MSESRLTLQSPAKLRTPTHARARALAGDLSCPALTAFPPPHTPPARPCRHPAPPLYAARPRPPPPSHSDTGMPFPLNPRNLSLKWSDTDKPRLAGMLSTRLSHTTSEDQHGKDLGDTSYSVLRPPSSLIRHQSSYQVKLTQVQSKVSDETHRGEHLNGKQTVAIVYSACPHLYPRHRPFSDPDPDTQALRAMHRFSSSASMMDGVDHDYSKGGGTG